jgi:hypothetical protein
MKWTRSAWERTAAAVIAVGALGLAACEPAVVTTGQPGGTATVPAPQAPGNPPAGQAPGGPAPGGHANHPGLPYDHSAVPAADPRDITDRPLVRLSGITAQHDPNDAGAFRIVCRYSHMNNDDPIVFPGRAGASHLHTFFGNTGTTAASTAATIAAGGGTSCDFGTGNRSAYWVPAVIDTASGRPVAPALVHVYYKSGYKLPPESIRTIPAGLRMVVGDPKATAYQGREVGAWSCFGASGPQATIPTCGPEQQVSMDVSFPQCSNGQLDSPDHHSHVTEPEQVAANPPRWKCPASHPIAMPKISFHVVYPAGADSRAWRLASDPPSGPAGYSLHADWLDGWDPAFKEKFLATCVRHDKTRCNNQRS